MKLLGEQDDVTLHITWGDGDSIEIPFAFAVNEPQRVYYPLEELAEMVFTQPVESQPEAEEAASEPEGEPKTEPAVSEPDEETMAWSESGGLPLALILGVAVIAAGLGFWFCKRKEQD